MKKGSTRPHRPIKRIGGARKLIKLNYSNLNNETIKILPV